MLYNEFTSLTGFYPAIDLFADINEAYSESDLDKREWCRNYVENVDGMAEGITYRHDMKAAVESSKAEKAHRDELAELRTKVAALEAENASLKTKISSMEGWHSYTDKDAYSQERYDALYKMCTTVRTYKRDDGLGMLTDDMACRIVQEETGFHKDYVRILHSAPVYEKSYQGRLRKVDEVKRLPMYEASDWNFIRFEVRGYTYELQDGGLSRVID